MSLIEPLGVSARSRCTASLRPGISPRGSVSFSDSPALVADSIRCASQSFVIKKIQHHYLSCMVAQHLVSD